MGPRSFARQCSASCALRQIVPQPSKLSIAALQAPRSTYPRLARPFFSNHKYFHTVPSRRKGQGQPPAQAPPTDFGELDVLGNTPVPSTSVDVCMYDGFGLNSGTTVTDGNGVLLIDGEVFNWRPWEAKGSMELANKKGQFEIPREAFAVFDLLWPRPGTFISFLQKMTFYTVACQCIESELF